MRKYIAILCLCLLVSLPAFGQLAIRSLNGNGTNLTVNGTFTAKVNATNELAVQQGGVSVAGSVTAASFSGSGLALTALPAFAAPYTGANYAKNRFIQAEFPNGVAIVSVGAVSSTVTGTGSTFAPAAGLPIGTQFTPVSNVGGICGENLTVVEWWSTNSATTVWDVSYISDVSSNRLWNSIGTGAPGGIDQIPKSYGFMKPSTNANWIAYSNDGTITNNVNTGVTVAIGTFYHLVTVKSNSTITYYLNGVSVATNTWSISPVAGVRHNWGGNALNSQASGVVLHYFYNEHTP